MKHAVNEATRKPKTPELDDKIRRRAYELYEERGRIGAKGDGGFHFPSEIFLESIARPAI